MAQSQNEERKAAMNAIRKLQWGILAGMDNAFIAKVIDYNERDHTADILPLANSSDGESCYMIDEIIERLKPEYEKVDAKTGSNLADKLPKKKLMRKGVPVVAVVLDRDNDNWEGGRAVITYTPNSSRVHDANDAIIVGVLGGDAKDG